MGFSELDILNMGPEANGRPVDFSPVGYGLRETEPENIELKLPYQEKEQFDTGPWNESLHLIRRALNIRSLVEWTAWTKGTIFPGDINRFEQGEPQGQCMVTARFAKPYFPGSRITEVDVKKKDGTVAGPHIVLSLQDNIGNDIYLDLTPDQDDASGDLPRSVTESNPLNKIGISAVDHPSCPYIFKRYQSDEELAIKKSQPLEHTRLLWEMMAYRYPQPLVHKIQRFAVEQTIDEAKQVSPTHPAILSRVINVGTQLGKGQSIQVGIVNNDKFVPSPDWIWKATGLNGLDTVIVEDRGYIKQVLTYNGDQIVHVNFRGNYTGSQLSMIKNEIVTDPNNYDALFYPNLLEEQIYSSGITGPIFVG